MATTKTCSGVSRHHLPITREELEEYEKAWLNSGDDDENGSHSGFIDKHYTDDEKQALWDGIGTTSRADAA
jgi:hypothetical protein